MAALKMKTGLLALVVMAIIARTHSLVQDAGLCLLSPQLCGMKDADFKAIFNICKEYSEGKKVPTPDARCCQKLNSLSGNCLCKGFEVHLSILPPDYDLTAPLKLPHNCGFPLDPPGCTCGKYTFPS